jgi:hypothetical protein
MTLQFHLDTPLTADMTTTAVNTLPGFSDALVSVADGSFIYAPLRVTTLTLTTNTAGNITGWDVAVTQIAGTSAYSTDTGGSQVIDLINRKHGWSATAPVGGT